jgi:para-aminobenzoate synthetase component I
MKTKTVSLPGFDPLLILCKLDTTQRLPALVRAGNWTVLAWNPVSTVTSWDGLQAALERRKSTASALPFTGGLIGYIGYDTTYDLLKVRATAKDDLHLPAMCFHEYDNAVLFDGKRVHIVGGAPFVDEVRETHERSLMPMDIPALHLKPGITKAAYRAAFKHIQRAILDGDIYQINYAYRFTGVCAADKRHLFASLFHRNPASRASHIETDDCALLSLSPEQFVSINGDRVKTSPIKGTRPRGATPQKDQRLRSELLASHKEQAELNMITDLLRNDLGQICRAGSVKVREHRHERSRPPWHRAVQANPSVWHTYSVIEGRLEPGCSVTTVFRSMLPGGSITGCPKKRAAEYIDQLEPLRRGPYTGTLAMFSDNGRVESSILIRTLIAKQDQIYLHVGGGIVADSDWQSEWDETLAKAATFLRLPEVRDAIREKQPSLYWINGKAAGKHDPRLQFLDPKVPGCFAVFETMRTYGKHIAMFDQHLARLESSARLLGFSLPKPASLIGQWLENMRQKADFRPSRLKVVATPEDIIMRCDPLSVKAAEIVSAGALFFPLVRDIPGAKNMPFCACIAAQERALSQGCLEALLVNPQGRVTEGACSNLFWVEHGTLWTPDADMLPGITRATVIRLARAAGMHVKFALPTMDRLLRADEVFITRTTIGIVPIIHIGGAPIAHGKTGPITGTLLRLWRKHVGNVLE